MGSSDLKENNGSTGRVDSLYQHLFVKAPTFKSDFFAILFSLVVLGVYVSPMLTNFSNLQNDMDWYGFGSMYESFRIAVLEYHQFPLRTFYLEGGYPMIGFPYDISLSPFAILILLFGSTPGMKLMMLISFAIGAWGIFYLLRRALNFNLAASLFGTLTFILSAWMPMQVDNANVPLLMAPYLAVWPIAFYIRSLKDVRYVVAGALCFYPILTLTVQSAIPLSIFLGFICLLYTFTGVDTKIKLRLTLKPVAVLLLMGIFAALFAAPKLLPVLDLRGRLTEYVHMENEDDYVTVSEHIIKYYGAPRHHQLFTSATRRLTNEPRGEIDIYYLYAGFLPLVLGLLGLILVWRKSTRLTLLFILIILFNLGPNSPLNLHAMIWNLFPPTQFIWKINKYFSPYIMLTLPIWGAVFFEFFKKRNRQKIAVILGFFILIGLAVADPMTNNRRLFEGIYTKPMPAKSLLNKEPFGQVLIRDIPLHRYNDISSVTSKERHYSQYAYMLMFKNIGTINWPTNMLLHQGGIIPKYYAPSFETIDYDVLSPGLLNPNPEYRGEVYFPEGSKNKVLSTELTPNYVTVAVNVFDAAPLMINQNYHDHFTTSIGELFNAKGAVGVKMPKGKQTVTIKFVHKPFYDGLALAAISLLASLMILSIFSNKSVANMSNFGKNIRYFVRLMSSKITRTPKAIFLSYAVTDHCNGRCVYCHIPRTPVNELDFESIEKIFKQMAKAGLWRVSLTGGEPLLYKNFPQLVDLLKGLGFWISVNTNGDLVKKQIDSLLKVDAVAVSIDGPKSVHNATRGEGSFEKAAIGLRNLFYRGVQARMVTVLNNINVNHIDEIISTAEDMDVEVMFQPIWKNALGTQTPIENPPAPKQMNEAIRRLIKLKKEGAPIANSLAGLKHFNSWPKGKNIGCLAGLVTYRLEPDGMFTNCERMPGEQKWIDLKTVSVANAISQLPVAGCSQCWCGGQVELQLAGKLNRSAIWNMLRKQG